MLDLQLKVRELEVIQKKDMEALREAIGISTQAAEKALELNAEQVETHLKALNHEAEQLKKMQATYLPREVWENIRIEIERKLELVVADMNKGFGRREVMSALIALAVSIFMALLLRGQI